jgi:hypothetical protein
MLDKLGDEHTVMVSAPLGQNPPEFVTVYTQVVPGLANITKSVNFARFAVKNAYNSSHFQKCFGVKNAPFSPVETLFW